ncbi:MAG TPA: hypothetical protein H9948_11925 [Candidatus Jeotgalibaca merdavium]|uniref:Uncharacterized protein n=1 Tax=Candidatus Jeotgalibaca merdavium TaxID=2838627 RepID=A0A9D2KYE6_9LACT|nr:hypothetical protein [Candidatus Jeotgalibaca merdavium]
MISDMGYFFKLFQKECLIGILFTAQKIQISFTNVVAMENAEFGITANSILPGPTRSIS